MAPTNLGGARPCFESAVDAAAGQLWSAEWLPGDLDLPRHATQRRRLERCGRLLGLSGLGGDRVAEALGCDLVLHREIQAAWIKATGREKRGQCVATILAQLEDPPRVWLRILWAGMLTGCWGSVRVLGKRTSRPPIVALAARAPPHKFVLSPGDVGTLRSPAG